MEYCSILSISTLRSSTVVYSERLIKGFSILYVFIQKLAACTMLNTQKWLPVNIENTHYKTSLLDAQLCTLSPVMQSNASSVPLQSANVFLCCCRLMSQLLSSGVCHVRKKPNSPPIGLIIGMLFSFRAEWRFFDPFELSVLFVEAQNVRSCTAAVNRIEGSEGKLPGNGVRVNDKWMTADYLTCERSSGGWVWEAT